MIFEYGEKRTLEKIKSLDYSKLLNPNNLEHVEVYLSFYKSFLIYSESQNKSNKTEADALVMCNCVSSVLSSVRYIFRDDFPFNDEFPLTNEVMTIISENINDVFSEYMSNAKTKN